MMARLYVDPDSAPTWGDGAEFELPPEAARHAQVLRLQPGDGLCIFNGTGGQWPAEVVRMSRGGVRVRLAAHENIERELPVSVTLAVCIPANDRMDALVEKATELGAAGIIPVTSQRSVLRISGHRAVKRLSHWQSVVRAACEQCGRNRLPLVHPVQPLDSLLGAGEAPNGLPGPLECWQLSLAAGAVPLAQAWRARVSRTAARPDAGLLILSGPEGGLAPVEQARAQAVGFMPVGLGPRTLRADTAPLATLATLATLAALAAPGIVPMED